MHYLWNELTNVEREQYSSCWERWQQMTRMERYWVVENANRLVAKLSNPDEIRSAILRARHFRHDFEEMYDY